MSVGTGRQNIIILFLDITVLFLGVNKWEPDIYMGFSAALYLQIRNHKNPDLIRRNLF
jgi:hypothetical protein